MGISTVSPSIPWKFRAQANSLWIIQIIRLRSCLFQLLQVRFLQDPYKFTIVLAPLGLHSQSSRATTSMNSKLTLISLSPMSVQ
jgi:hypothetical protein